MASRWELLRDAVAAAVEALTPETDAGVTYHDADSDSVLEGSSGRRAFWQDPPSAEGLTQQDASTVRYRYTWTLNMQLSRGVATIADFAKACVTEPLNVARALLVLAPTTGAEALLVPGWTTTTIGDADLVLIEIQLISEIDEVL